MARSVVWLSLAATAWATPADATDSWLVAQQGAKLGGFGRTASR